MEPRIDHGRLVGAEPGSSSARIRSMKLTGAFMTLCALVACGEGKQASLATPVLSYNGSIPFPAIGERPHRFSELPWSLQFFRWPVARGTIDCCSMLRSENGGQPKFAR